jgi:SAM-dependent methyltransferase
MSKWDSQHKDFSSVTETAGIRVTREAASMIYTRYHFASDFCQGKDVLEVACGSGAGLGYLARHARKVIGGDYTESLLLRAQSHYRGRIPLVRLDAHALPFPASCFDVVILFEAIYYLSHPEVFLAECERVLRPGGLLLISTVNRESETIIPSPDSTRYFSTFDLYQLLRQHQFEVQLFSAFPAGDERNIVTRVRKLAGRLHLIPKTMKGKESLKRLFYGPLVQLGGELEEEIATLKPLMPVVPGGPVNDYKVIYAIAQKVSNRVPALTEAHSVGSAFG